MIWFFGTPAREAVSLANLGSALRIRPRFINILLSKPVRLTAIIIAAVVFLLGLLDIARRHNSLPELASSHWPPPKDPGLERGDVDWSRFAYVQYVTNSDYLCNSVMIFETLHRLGSKADRVMMYPSTMVDPKAARGDSRDARLLIKARDQYRVRLQPIEVQRRPNMDAMATEAWQDSFTKLLAFNQTKYDRVLSLDSDSTVMQPMDELFLLPSCPVAMPRAYWLYPEHKILSSQLVLVQPSAAEFQRITAEMERAGENGYDMEIVNTLYKDNALVLPHRPYNLLTGEFRGKTHGNYLGTDREEWDAVAIYNEAKFVHFSDWPVPKPWIPMGEGMRRDKQPQFYMKDGLEQCIERQIWNALYSDFGERRKRVCNVDSSRQSRSINSVLATKGTIPVAIEAQDAAPHRTWDLH